MAQYADADLSFPPWTCCAIGPYKTAPTPKNLVRGVTTTVGHLAQSALVLRQRVSFCFIEQLYPDGRRPAE